MNIFEYDHYRPFLNDSIAAFPKKGRGQVNRIAEHIKAHPTLVSQVLNGDRDFSVEQILKISTYLGLQPLENDFLILLLQHERAGTNELTKYYKAKIDDLRKNSLNLAARLNKQKTLDDTERATFYSSWIYLATWLFTSVDEGQSLDSIAERFSLNRAQASEVIHFLLKLQLCSEENGLYKMSSQHIHLEYGSPLLPRHHSNWRVKSLQRTDDITEEELMFSSPFSVSKKDFLKIREEIVKLIKSTSSIIKDSPAEEIACMNLDLFWIKK